MILKDIDKKDNLQKYQKYGYEAEKQMAFYLKRAFQDSQDIHVINDLRLEMNDDVAQIDHLIIHRFGFVILESKSVTSKISINDHEEWTRHYPKYTRGMPSPINQARRQADFLLNFLMARSQYLLRKKLVFKASISDFKFDVLVAVSDSGIINRAKNTKIEGVHKADQITQSITDTIAEYAGTNKKVLSLKVNYQFADTTMDNITKYLINSHRQKRKDAVETIKEQDASISKVSEDAPRYEDITKPTVGMCGKCKSTNTEITYGRYGYYFKCLDCEGNTSIKLKCKDNACKPKLRKAKMKFYQECSTCSTSVLYFTNKVKEDA